MEYRRHPTFTAIQDADKGSCFFFVLFKTSMLLGKSKASTEKAIHDDNIHVKILKENVNFFAEQISVFYNNAITISKVPYFLKTSNVTPIFQKGSKNKKENFRAVRILQFLLRVNFRETNM